MKAGTIFSTRFEGDVVASHELQSIGDKEVTLDFSPSKTLKLAIDLDPTLEESIKNNSTFSGLPLTVP